MGPDEPSHPRSPLLHPTPPHQPLSRTRSPLPGPLHPRAPTPSIAAVSVSTRVGPATPSTPATPRKTHRRNGTGSRSLLSSPLPSPDLLAPPAATVAAALLDVTPHSGRGSAGSSTGASGNGSGSSSRNPSPQASALPSPSRTPTVGLLAPAPSYPRGRTSSTSQSASQSQSPSPSPSPSRKGKERADGSTPTPPPLDPDADAVGHVVPVSNDVRRGLRELAARGSSGRGRKRTSSHAHAVTELPLAPDRPYSPRRYYVLTNAGKPVVALNHSNEDSLSELMGLAQALISIVAEDDDRLRSIVRGRTRIVFVLKAPLYLFAVSDWGEPEYVLRMHLEYINLQILSVVSGTQLSRAFQRRSNFDLSRLLEGSEPYLRHLVTSCQSDLSFFTTTLQPLRMPPSVRDTSAAALMPPAKFKDLLYVLLIAGGRIVTLLRPRRHAVHPADMHLLLNTLATSSALRTIDTWLPICLPKFNPSGFVHAYISYVREDVGLVFVSADRDAFEPLCTWRAAVEETLKRDGTLDRIEAAVKTHEYPVTAVGSPGLRHFIYKSRGLIQLTAPTWDDPYLPDSVAQRRLLTLYATVQDALFARSGQAAPLKLVYISTPHEAVLGWLTKPFELYITVSPLLPMSAVVATANRVAKWVNAEESRLFLKDAPVF